MNKPLSVVLLISMLSVILLAGCGKDSKKSPEGKDDNDTKIGTESTGSENTDAEILEAGDLISFIYHPGYSDMEGGRHSESLMKNDGKWIIECIDRETFSDPVKITAYAVSDEKLTEFESFIKDENILALTERKESDTFVTDYSPWSYSITFDNTALGGGSYESYSIREFMEYSDSDKELLKELGERFKALRGKMISESTVNEEDEDEPEDETEQDKDYEAYYAPVLNETYEIVTDGYDFDRQYEYMSDGLMEKCMYPGDDDLTQAVGYVRWDVSGDGIPELFIGCDEDYGDLGPQSYIYNVFTLKDDKPVYVFDGWARNSYRWMGDDHFCYLGSGGASITIFGENHLSGDGTEIIWDDFYFSDEKGDGQIGLYHNTTGVFDSKGSEELNMSDEEFFDKMEAYEARCEQITWKPMGSYEGHN